jgi:hypothetical protein
MMSRMHATAIEVESKHRAPVQRPVICEGTHHDMGRAQGVAIHGLVRQVPRVLRGIEAIRMRKPWWMPWPMFRRISGTQARRMLEPVLIDAFADARDRLHGIADGARAPAEGLYLLNALEPMMSSVRECTVTPPLGGCSAVAVRGGRSATGEPIVAHNFDYLPLVQSFYFLRESRPSGRLRSLDFTIAPMCGAVDGMNERGLCITYNYAYAVDNETPSGSISMAVSEALERCSTVGEAADWIVSRPRWGAGVLMLADAEGDIASLEVSATRTCLRRPDAGGDVLFHTNCYSTDEMRNVEVDADAVFTDDAPTPLRGQKVLVSSESRNRRFTELFDARQMFDADDVAALMSDHGTGGGPSSDTICMHSDYWYTTACLQFFPRSRRVRIAYNSACRAEYESFEL